MVRDLFFRLEAHTGTGELCSSSSSSSLPEPFSPCAVSPTPSDHSPSGSPPCVEKARKKWSQNDTAEKESKSSWMQLRDT